MAAFAYKAVDDKGQKIVGTIQADSTADAERRLAQQDVVILSLAPAGSGSAKSNSGSVSSGAQGPTGRAGKKVSSADAAEVLRGLAVMAETGVPFVEAIDAVLAAAKTKSIELHLTRVRDSVVGGMSLSGALKTAPEMFPTLVTDMVKIAEAGGRLDAALGSGASYLERAAEMKKKVQNAMMYPCVMLGVCVLTLLIMILVVMPKFAGVFASMKAELPWLTKTMLGAGDAAKKNPIGTGLTLFGIFAGGFVGLRLPVTRAVFNKLALRLPLLGELIRRLALARALQSISTLSASGVPLLHAIEQGARVAGPNPIGAALLTARDAIERGASMSDAMKATGAFPRSTIQMVAVGERTGRLPELLKRLADGMETDVDARLKALVAVIEPLMIVIMGTVVGGITVSIIGPIYSVVENVK